MIGLAALVWALACAGMVYGLGWKGLAFAVAVSVVGGLAGRGLSSIEKDCSRWLASALRGEILRGGALERYGLKFRARLEEEKEARSIAESEVKELTELILRHAGEGIHLPHDLIDLAERTNERASWRDEVSPC